LIVINFSRFAR